MRDLFVGMLCTIGAILFCYRGNSLQEDVALNIAGIAAVLIALFPMDWLASTAIPMSMAAKVHSASAVTLFVAIAYVCVFRARGTLWILPDEGRRKAFQHIYRVFGILMLATPTTVALLNAMSTGVGTGYRTLLVEEAPGVFVFAALWLVKSWEIRSAVRARLTARIE